MNRKNFVCILIVLITILCFASGAAADCYSYQSTYNPYAGVSGCANSYSGYGGYGTCNSYGYSCGNTYSASCYNGYGYNSCNGYASASTTKSSTSNYGIIDCAPTGGNNAACTTTQSNNCWTNSNSCYQTTSYCQPSAASYYANCEAYVTGNTGNCGTSYNPYSQPRSNTANKPSNSSTATNQTNKPQQDDGYYTPSTLTSQERILADMVNYERTSRGLGALNVDLQLVSLARQKSLDMIQNGYFAHESPTYGSAAKMLTNAGYKYNGVGENIARNGSTEKAHAALMSSDGHRQNILGSQWTKLGVGIVNDFNGYPYITELFVR